MEGDRNAPGKLGINGGPQKPRDVGVMSSSNEHKTESSVDVKMIENPLPPSGDEKMMKAPVPVPPPKRTPRRPSSQSLVLDKAVEIELHNHPDLEEDDVDIKKLRRTVSNRLSAQRSRKKKAYYEGSIETKSKDLQERVFALFSKIEMEKEKQNQIIRENETLQNVIEARIKEAKISESELAKKWAELLRLQELAKSMNLNTDGDGDGDGDSGMQKIMELDRLYKLGKHTQLPCPDWGVSSDLLQNSWCSPVPSCQWQTIHSNSYRVFPTTWPVSVSADELTLATAQPLPDTSATGLQQDEGLEEPEKLLVEEMDIDQFINYEAIDSEVGSD